jgi:hypothetical protein
MSSTRNETVLDLQFVEQAVDPDEEGFVRRVGNDLVAYIGGEAHSLIAGAGSGITEAQHQTLLQLIHFLDEGPAKGFTSGATKTVTGTVFPTQVLWKRQDGTKLVEKNITWTGVNPTTIEWKLYASDGVTVLETVTDTITYSGVFETGRTRVIA